MTRYDIERAVTRSTLRGPARLVMLALCTRIDSRSGVIPRRFTPSLSRLAGMTGLHESTVCRALTGLEAGGWLERHRPTIDDARRLHARTHYVLLVPSLAVKASRTGLGGQVAEDGLASRAARGGLVAEDGLASRAAPDSQTTTDQRPIISPEMIALAQAEIKAATGRSVTKAQASEAVRLVTDGRTLRNPQAYLRRAIRAEPQRFIPASTPPRYAELARLEAEAITRGNRQTGGK